MTGDERWEVLCSHRRIKVWVSPEVELGEHTHSHTLTHYHTHTAPSCALALCIALAVRYAGWSERRAVIGCLLTGLSPELTQNHGQAAPLTALQSPGKESGEKISTEEAAHCSLHTAYYTLLIPCPHTGPLCSHNDCPPVTTLITPDSRTCVDAE